MMANPEPTAVIRGWAAGAMAPAATKTLAGEIAILDESPLLKATVTPLAGAGVVKVTGKAAEPLGASVTPTGSVIAPEGAPVPTSTVSVSPVRLYADALTEADPTPTPVIFTGRAALEPSGIKTAEGDTVTMEVSLLSKLTKTPPGAAGFDNVNGNTTC